MTIFESKWAKWRSSEEGSATFDTAPSEQIPSKLNGEIVVLSAKDYLGIKTAIISGKNVQIWSESFNEWIYFTYDSASASRLRTTIGNATIYTLVELSLIMTNGLKASHLGLVQAIKKTFNATITKIEKADK